MYGKGYHRLPQLPCGTMTYEYKDRAASGDQISYSNRTIIVQLTYDYRAVDV